MSSKSVKKLDSFNRNAKNDEARLRGCGKMGKGLTMPDRLEFLWQYHMNKIPDASKKVEGAKPESKTVPINRVNNEIKDYLFRFPNFISTTLDHLDQADQPLKTPNVVVDIPKLMVVDQASMLWIMMLTQCSCGSG
jgi:hypothetical protein